jgi:hypothetical protein
VADNLTTGSSGSVVAFDDISSVFYARMKMIHGVDGTNDGDVSTANPFPVRLYVGTTSTALGNGVHGSALRVTLASDSTGTVAATQSGTWNVTNVSGTVSLPTGASTLAEQQSQTTHLATIAGDTTAIETAVQLIDDAIYTDGTGTPSKGIAVMGTDGTNPQLVSVTASGHVNIADGGNTITVDGTVAATQSGTWTVDLGATDNAVLDAIAASLAGTLTVGSHAVTNAGTFAVQAAQSGTWNITNVSGTVSLPTGASTLAEQQSQTTALQIMDDWDNAASDGASVSGDVAHDTADAGEPLKLGAKANTSLSGLTLVANNDRTNLFAGIDGVLIMREHCNLEDIVAGNASNTDGASTEVIATAGAGVKQYLTSVTLTNTSASDIYVEMKSATTVRWRFPVPAGGGVTHSWNPPLPPNAANEAWNFDPSAAATTVYCSATGFKSKV